MTASEKIVKYLKSRKTGATAFEIAQYANVNYNTVRRTINELKGYWKKQMLPLRKCRVTGKMLTTYSM